MAPPGDFYSPGIERGYAGAGGGSTGSTTNVSPAASTYNLNLTVEPELVDGVQITIPESRVLIIMTG
jgi:hypothetical protein